jgi:hypothetical protein
VSREAIEDYVVTRGLPSPKSDHDLVHYMETYQPEFVRIAIDKHRQIETVLITSEDVAR